MAKIKFGAFMTDMRGKIGGTIFSRNKGGAYSKNKVTPSNPQTALQQAARALLTSLSQAWRSLTQVQRDTWSNAAPDFPVVDVFGDTTILSGNMLYNRLNANLSKVGEPTLTSAPAPSGTQDSQLVDVTDDGVTLSVRITEAVDAGMRGMLRVTPQFGVGIGNYKNKLRDFSIILNADGTNFDIKADYVSRFGALVSGKAIGFEFYTVNAQSGEESTPSKYRLILP